MDSKARPLSDPFFENGAAYKREGLAPFADLRALLSWHYLAWSIAASLVFGKVFMPRIRSHAAF